MLKFVMTLVLAVVLLGTTGCCSSCGSGGSRSAFLHCECPCYAKSFQKDAYHIMDFVDVYFLNYDKHDPYRCDPCIGD